MATQPSSSSNGNKSVRFAASEPLSSETLVSNDRVRPSLSNRASRDDAASHEYRPLKKRKVVKDDRRMNADELDDIDEWDAHDDADDDGPVNVNGGDSASIPREHELLRAKRERRTKQRSSHGSEYDDNDYDPDGGDINRDTRIDNRTSLASEGIEVEPFHMDNERSDGSGYFDGDTYVFRKAPNDASEEPDAWLEGLDEETKNDETSASRRRRTADMLREAERRQEKAKQDKERMDEWSEQDLYAKVFSNLGDDNETVMQALVRLGNLFQVKKGSKEEMDSSAAVRTSRQYAQTAFNELTEAANALLLKGKIDIYQMKRPHIRTILPAATDSTANATAAVAVQWEYRGNQDGAIHGLYSTQEMLAWIQAGYFVGPTAVLVRSVQEPVETVVEKSMQDDLLSDLMEDDGEEDTAQASSGKNTSSKEPVRGEWILSDAVDFKTSLMDNVSTNKT
jgi:CD2 antigen cytoplasmic tail-binding protein 2